MTSEREIALAREISKKLHTPLAAGSDNPGLAKTYPKGGYGQKGYGVPEGASIDGSFAAGAEGGQGYYVDAVMPEYGSQSGKDFFVSCVARLKDFFEGISRRNGKPVRLVIKTGIGGQHTPFQAIADMMHAASPDAGRVTGEYELGKNYADSITCTLGSLGAGWEQLAVIPSSKSGSTDETMVIFTDIFYAMLSAHAKTEGIDGRLFANIVLDVMHESNFNGAAEVAKEDLFRRFSIKLISKRVQERVSDSVSYETVKRVFQKTLGNLFFETTDRPSQSRLSAFIRHSGLDSELGREYTPGFGPMFDNVGGRWTGDLHMMTFLAFYGLDAASYWETRRRGIEEVRNGSHDCVRTGNMIADTGIKDIALLVPGHMLWFGKAMEQNFNESIWQDGFANLISIEERVWSAQSKYYENRKNTLVIDLTGMQLDDRKFNAVHLPGIDLKSGLGNIADGIGGLFTFFYGMSHTVGNRLIARQLLKKRFAAEDVDLNDTDKPASSVVQENLYLRQPYVELGKGLLETKLSDIQAARKSDSEAIQKDYQRALSAGRARSLSSNVPGVSGCEVETSEGLSVIVAKLYAHASSSGRKFVPFVYLEGNSFIDMRVSMAAMGIEWVMQGTGDQHISYQQVLARPARFLPFIVSFLPETPLPGKSAIGFAKGYLDGVSPHMIRDAFAEASYKALTELRKGQSGTGCFLRLTDTPSERAVFTGAFKKAFIRP